MSLQLTQLNCKIILASSDTIALVVENVNNYASIKVDIQKQCCGTQYSSTIITTNFIPIYTITLPTSSIILKHIVFDTSENGNLIQGTGDTVVTSCSDIITCLESFSGPLTDFTFDCNVVDNNFVITFTPILITSIYLPITLQYTLSSAPTILVDVQFTIPDLFLIGSKLAISSNIINNVLPTFDDNVYSINILFTDTNGSIVNQTGCLFIDCKTTCRVATAISQSSGQLVTDLLVYHYGLSFSQDCMCDCDYLCNIFSILNNLLNSVISNNNITNDCGCS